MMTSQRELQETLLELLPDQGCWSEEEYLLLTDHGNLTLEYTDGYIEVLPTPTRKHQAISKLLFLAFLGAVEQLRGTVFYVPLRLRIAAGKFREPDILLLLDANDPRNQERYWLGADLVLEIVSPDNQEPDLTVKRREYAAAGIPEYWIVNPQNETILVLRLADGSYVEHGTFTRGTQATSALLVGFTVDVNAVFEAK